MKLHNNSHITPTSMLLHYPFQITKHNLKIVSQWTKIKRFLSYG